MITVKNRITGLDIGSSKVAGAVAESRPDGSLDILAHADKDISGVSRGVITGLNDAARSVSAVVAKLKSAVAGNLGDVYANAAGESVKGKLSKGMIPLSVRGREVSLGDMKRASLAAGTIHVPIDREILHRIVHSYSVDDQPPIPDALGLYASRLSCEMYVVTADANHVQNVMKCVHLAGCDAREIVYSGIASGMSVLTASEREEGALMLDVGSRVTEACVFSGGSLQCMENIAIGGSDMSAGFKDDPAFNRMLGAVRAGAAPFIQGEKALKTIVVTGGTSFADGFLEALEEKLSHPVRMGMIKEIRGDLSGQDSVRLAGAIGLVKYAHEKRRQGIRGAGTAAKRLSEKVVDLLNNYF